jgi:hypothetical protein
MKYLIIAILISIPCYYYFGIVLHREYEQGMAEYHMHNRIIYETEMAKEASKKSQTETVDAKSSFPYVDPYTSTMAAPSKPNFSKLNTSLSAPSASTAASREAAASAAFSYDVSTPKN